MRSKTPLSFLALCLFLLSALLYGCPALKKSKPLLPQKEYEKMLLGNLSADYVGNANCLKACHVHDKIRRDFEASTMGAQLSYDSGMPVVDCESCHGPGSLAIEGITPEKVEADRRHGKTTACNYNTLIDFNTLPAPAYSLVCLKCHTANATFNLHNWNVGAHAANEVSCSDCHSIHAGPDLTPELVGIKDMCFQCHQKQRAEFFLPSRHPVMENRVFCVDCHDGHGTATEGLLKKFTIKETCIQCHTEKAGPFLFEHADNSEDCSGCHSPHGSINDNLLKLNIPFLCLQCHEGHRITISGGAPSSLERKQAFFTRCTDCHSEIHGTDTPSASGKGRFIQ